MDSHALIILAEMLAQARRMSVATISTWMGGSGDTIARLQRGCDITTGRAKRFGQKFSDHWPTDLPWPSDIPRPAPTPGAPAALAAAEASPEDAA